MNTLKHRITTGWNWMRVVRIVIGLVGIFAAWNEKLWLIGLAGGFFLIQGILGAGCENKGCAVPLQQQEDKNTTN